VAWFSNCGTHTITGTPAIVYWNVALINDPNMKQDKDFKKINKM
jgi:hypothetical protein